MHHARFSACQRLEGSGNGANEIYVRACRTSRRSGSDSILGNCANTKSGPRLIRIFNPSKNREPAATRSRIHPGAVFMLFRPESNTNEGANILPAAGCPVHFG